MLQKTNKMIGCERMAISRKKKDVEEEVIRHGYVRELVVFNTQYSMLSPYCDTTVVRTPDVVMRGRFTSKENRFRGEEYLLNYRTNNDAMGFKLGLSRFYNRDAILTASFRNLREDTDDTILLPKRKNLKVSIGSVIESRRSVRKFSGRSVTIESLSTILYYAQGVSGELKLKDKLYDNAESIKLRNAPSGGGLYPIRLFLAVWNVKGLDKGIYLYYPYTHAIKPIKVPLTLEDMKSFASFGDIEAEKTGFSIMYVYDFFVNTRKYGDAAMAYAFIEAGEIAQNVQLTATALGYGACDLGGYEKQRIEKYIGVDGISKHVIHFTTIGEGMAV